MEKRERISKTEGAIMLVIAGAIETVQLLIGWIPFLGWIVASFFGVLGWSTFLLWFSIKGISVFGNRPSRALYAAGTGMVESVFGFLPTLTFWVMFMVNESRKEDAKRREGVPRPQPTTL